MLRGAPGLLVALTLAGCPAPYAAGAFLNGDGAHFAVAVGCLELRGVPERASPPSVLVEFDLGNRCYNPTCFDLRDVRAKAYDPDLERVELRPHDPRGELRWACLDGRAKVTERLLYVSSNELSWPTATICLDYSRLLKDQRRTVRCFRLGEAGAVPAGEP